MIRQLGCLDPLSWYEKFLFFNNLFKRLRNGVELSHGVAWETKVKTLIITSNPDPNKI